MTVQIDAIQEVFDVLYRKEMVCDFGVDELQLDATINLAIPRYPDKGVSAVKNWMWWDFDISEDLRNRFLESGMQPAIIFANYLIWDSRNRWPEGYQVKTTELITFEENYFFVTRNTVYILVGKGHRKTVDPHVAASVHF